MMFKKAFAVLLCTALIFSSLAFSSQAGSELGFRDDGTFTILQITDPQDDQHPAFELNGFILKALAQAQPDLVVFTGDIVEDSRLGDLNSDDEPLREGVLVEDDYEQTLANVKAACAAVFTPVEEAGIPFAVTQGNNDYKSKVTNEDWLKIFAEYPHCLTCDMSDDEEGKIDSFVPLYSTGGAPVFGLWLLDNGKGFTQGQLDWFKAYSAPAVPSIVFEHVPVAEVGNLFEKCSVFDENALAGDGGIYHLNSSVASGHAEFPCAPCEPTEVFTAWKSKGVVGAFFGHTHTEGYTGTYDGITLGLTYGCEFTKAGAYGMRTITINENNPSAFETELFVYENGAFTAQTDTPYRQPQNAFEQIIFGCLNLFSFVIHLVGYALKF